MRISHLKSPGGDSLFLKLTEALYSVKVSFFFLSKFLMAFSFSIYLRMTDSRETGQDRQRQTLAEEVL